MCQYSVTCPYIHWHEHFISLQYQMHHLAEKHFRLNQPVKLFTKFHAVTHELITLLSTYLDDYMHWSTSWRSGCDSIKVMKQWGVCMSRNATGHSSEFKRGSWCPAAVPLQWGATVFVGKIMEFNRDGGNGMHSLPLCFYLGNISMTDGQHVILMLRLWQQLKVKLRCSCKRQRLGVIKQEALKKYIYISCLTSWRKLIPKSNLKCINFAWLFPHPSW